MQTMPQRIESFAPRHSVKAVDAKARIFATSRGSLRNPGIKILAPQTTANVATAERMKVCFLFVIL
jgi:hypothetical protein